MSQTSVYQAYSGNTYLFGGNAPYVEEMYENYLSNPGSVPDSWRQYFDALQHVPAVDGSNAKTFPISLLSMRLLNAPKPWEWRSNIAAVRSLRNLCVPKGDDSVKSCAIKKSS